MPGAAAVEGAAAATGFFGAAFLAAGFFAAAFFAAGFLAAGFLAAGFLAAGFFGAAFFAAGFLAAGFFGAAFFAAGFLAAGFFGAAFFAAGFLAAGFFGAAAFFAAGLAAAFLAAGFLAFFSSAMLNLLNKLTGKNHHYLYCNPSGLARIIQRHDSIESDEFLAFLHPSLRFDEVWQRLAKNRMSLLTPGTGDIANKRTWAPLPVDEEDR